MSNLMQIEADFLTSAEVRSNVNFQSIFNLQSEVADAKKSKFDKSLKLAKLVSQSVEWFKSSETKTLLEDNGIEWSNTEVFFNRVFGGKSRSVTKWSRRVNCKKKTKESLRSSKENALKAENNGEDANRSIESLLKFAKAEISGEDTEVSREKTFATFSLAKDGINGDSGFSIRLTESGIKMSGVCEDNNTDNLIVELFTKLNDQMVERFNQINN